MAKTVGLSRNIKMSWMSFAASELKNVNDISEAKTILDGYLAAEIKSPDNLRKTKDILINIWIKGDDDIRQGAFELVEKYPEDKNAVFWCMLLSTYPVFYDICNTIGKMFKFQDELTLSQVKEKMFDIWGERTTLFHSIAKIMSTMKSLEGIYALKGKYSKIERTIHNEEVTKFVAYTYLKTAEGSYITLEDINDWDAMFSFDYRITREMIALDDRYQVTAFDGKPTIKLKTTL